MNKKSFLVLVLLLGLAAVIFFLVKNKEKGNVLTQSTSPVALDSTDELWFKQAIIYTLDVEVFQDSDGDGTGDINGLIQRLGYIDSLGATVIWLAPFQPTPNKDDGYDVSDYYAVDSRLGTLNDFRKLVAAAGQKGIRIIMDLVVNHTSNQHPWFQQARQSDSSPFHSWYVWSKEKPGNYNKGMVFPGVQKSIWTFDSTAGEYYYHRFYDFQPDLNTQNPAVQNEVRKIMKYWLDAGVAGFRLDGVPFFIEVPQTKGEEFDHQYGILNGLRQYVQSLRRDAVILGEANVPPKENSHYFGKKGEGLQMLFNFFVNQQLFYALATGDAASLKDALAATSDIPKVSQWGQFLRNHDEVDLGRLSNSDRQKVYTAFGPEKNMQLYDRGIRRRLAPMLKNNRPEMALAYSLLFSLPSTPVIRYGDEIGMGDDLSLRERYSVRTPMQWSAERQGGFTSASNAVRPVLDTGTYGYKYVNVKKELADSSSLLTWTRRMIGLRKSCPEIGYGSWKLLPTGSAHVLAIQYNWQGRTLVVLHNFSNEPQEVKTDDWKLKGSFYDILASKQLAVGGSVVLPGYGYHWLRIPEQSAGLP